MSKDYTNITQPFRLKNGQYLKNRIVYPNAQQSYVVGPESWPTEALIDEMAEICYSGASLMSFGQYDKLGGGAAPTKHTGGALWFFPSFDYSDPRTFNYLAQAAHVAHMYGTKILIRLSPSFPDGTSYWGGDAASLFPVPDDERLRMGAASVAPKKKKIFTREEMEARICPKERIPEVIQELVDMCLKYKKAGWDGMSFRSDRYLDASTNLRTDEYNGEIEDRALFQKQLFTAIKEACGEDFLIQSALMGESPHGHDGQIPHGYTEEEFIRFVKYIEDVVDIFEIREAYGTGYQRCMWNFREGEHPVLDYAKHLREAGFTGAIAVNGGFNNPDEMNTILGEGVVDLISTGRTFIAEPKFLPKLMSGGKEAPVPCISCNKCHGNQFKPNVFVCSVNPQDCQSHRLPAVIKPPIIKKKVAVIGGGPIGMRTACWAAERGHEVTLFEKTDFLGGKLRYAGLYPNKWTMEKYRLWLIDEMDRRGVEVRTGCAPDPEDITKEGFDAVIACTGSREKRPPVKGADAPGIWLDEDVYEGRAEIGQKVVFVGGGVVATETAMYLAELGKDVTMLTRSYVLMEGEARHHGPNQMWPIIIDELGYGGTGGAWAIYDNLKPEYGSKTIDIQPGRVTYIKDGTERTIECDTVIVSGGYEPCTEEALRYAGCANEFYMAGDVEKESTCLYEGNLRGYGKANLL